MQAAEKSSLSKVSCAFNDFIGMCSRLKLIKLRKSFLCACIVNTLIMHITRCIMLLCHFAQSNSMTNESIAVPPKPSSPKPSGVRSKISTPPKTKFGTPPRHSVAPRAPDACKCYFCGHFFCYWYLNCVLCMYCQN